MKAPQSEGHLVWGADLFLLSMIAFFSFYTESLD